MHVCLVTSGRPSEVFLGGEEKFTLSFRSWLMSHAYHVTIVSRKLFGVEVIGSRESDEVSVESESPATLQVPYLIYIVGMLITSFLLVLKIIEVNRRLRIAIIHAQDTGYGGLSAVISARILRIPVVISSHGIRHFTLNKILTDRFSKLLLIFEYWMDCIVARTADLVIVVASSQADFFFKIGVTKVSVVPIGIDVHDFQAHKNERHAVRKELNLDDDIIVGFVGRFSPEKNLETLIEAFAEASKCVRAAKLVLVGGGSIEADLRRLVHNKGIDSQVVFTGIRRDIQRLLSAMDIFIIPSFTEGCPTSLLEAMSSCKAIIASDIPSIREIVNNNNQAVLVNPHCVQELEHAILLLSESEETRRILGRNAAERVHLYDANVVYSQIALAYGKLLFRA